MPSLFRFLRTLAIIAAIVFAAMAALAYLVDPGRREVRLPLAIEELGGPVVADPGDE